MIKSERTKVIASRSLIAVLCVFFGILIAGQLRSIPDRITDPVAPYASLKTTKEELYSEQSTLKNEIQSLQKSIYEAQASADNTVLSNDQKKQLEYKKAQAGLFKLNGKGVIITLDDSARQPATEESIIHAADLRDTLNLLWGSGAEAISINDTRIVSTTAVDCIVNTILVNNVRLSSPFRIEAIGNQQLMLTKLNDHAYLSNIHDRKNNQGIVFDIARNNDITVPVYNGSFDSNLTS